MQKFTVFLAASLYGWLPNAGHATAFTDEGAWRAAVGGVFSLENFDSTATGSDVFSLPTLGIKFDPLNDGTQPTVQPYTSTGGIVRSGPNNLLNDRDFTLPARGPFVMRPINDSDLLFGIGLWNVGGDDTLRMSIYDASDSLIEQVISPSSSGFFGIVNSLGAKKVVIDSVAGNGYTPVDDLQTAVRNNFVVPDSGSTMLLLCGALLGIGLHYRKRQAA
jgi:hypothetical protein